MTRWTMVIRKRQWLRERPYCFLCEGRINSWPTFEHIIPKWIKKSMRQSNLALTCLLCNEKRGGMTMSQWRHSRFQPFEIEWVR